ncbi:zinc finger protein [Cinnamomum micranthum f. kanehirae]|uniref:Zinc finger protein n=1 Tax=Cinnamomum micranthum f. kanehirae TaxID=337451 RepID=A0A443PQX6_9MAGN|nr:zinc finger protein [Cinnamomum micranthum f. kanehirae]
MSSGSDTASSGHLLHNLGSGGLGLGYSIAIALGFLLLLSTILLASYACCHRHPHPTATNPNSNSVILPRIVFVSDDNDDHNDVVGGLDQTIISSYPKFPFAKSDTGRGSDPICSICLCEYREAEMLRMLPDCRHSFHLSCVDAWLRLNASCPVCRRTSPVPTPLSTPLSELVPLSQFPVNGRR